MADKDWIKRVVDTSGRPCPILLAEHCPGSRIGCAFWLDQEIRDDRANVELIGGCLFAWTYVQAHAVTLESVRTQAGIDKAATVLHDAGVKVAQAVANRATGGARGVLHGG